MWANFEPLPLTQLFWIVYTVCSCFVVWTLCSFLLLNFCVFNQERNMLAYSRLPWSFSRQEWGLIFCCTFSGLYAVQSGGARHVIEGLWHLIACSTPILLHMLIFLKFFRNSSSQVTCFIQYYFILRFWPWHLKLFSTKLFMSNFIALQVYQGVGWFV